ncbi:MAG: tetratricopeptide repeat protein [Deltaproteobacteria bacterium]|nr:tetratricopeptide repeat protein [Deltaproteobacteria bacterium]
MCLWLLAGPLPAAAGPEPAPADPPAAATARGAVTPEPGPHLLYVDLSVGGATVRVKAGGVMAIHPDAPFRVKDAATSAWLDLRLSFSLAGQADIDLTRFHTLSELLGQRIFEMNGVDLTVEREGQPVGSIRLLVKLLPIDWLRRAEAATKLDDKIKYMQQVLDLTPDDILVGRRLADLLLEAHRYPEAQSLLEELAAAHDDPELEERLAALYLKTGDKEKAVAALSKLAADRPDDMELAATLAGLYQDLGRWGEAVPVWERLARVYQGEARPKALLSLARALTRAGKPAEARAALEAAGKLQPANPATWELLAGARRQAGDNAGAVAALRRVADLRPRDKEARLNLARTLLESGQEAAAATELEKAAALDPADTALWLKLAAIYQKTDNQAALLRVYQKLAARKGDDPEVNYNLGVLLLEAGRPQEAWPHLEAAARARPDDVEIQETAFEALAGLGRWDQAVAQAQKLLAAAPDPVEAVSKVYPQLSEHRPAEMLNLLEEVLERQKGNPALYRMAAALALKGDDSARAVAILELAVRNLPGDLDLLEKLAQLYDGRGETAKAAEAYGRLLDQKPDFPGAEERYLQLKTKLLERGRVTSSTPLAPKPSPTPRATLKPTPTPAPAPPATPRATPPSTHAAPPAPPTPKTPPQATPTPPAPKAPPRATAAPPAPPQPKAKTPTPEPPPATGTRL